jgi:hypothetical protein
VGLLSLVFITLVLGLLFLTPAFAAGFILRGHGAGRLLGIALLGAWGVMILLVGRRIMRPPAP